MPLFQVQGGTPWKPSPFAALKKMLEQYTGGQRRGKETARGTIEDYLRMAQMYGAQPPTPQVTQAFGRTGLPMPTGMPTPEEMGEQRRVTTAGQRYKFINTPAGVMAIDLLNPENRQIVPGTAPPAKGPSPFTLSPGQTRYTPSGEPVAKVPAAKKAPVRLTERQVRADVDNVVNQIMPQIAEKHKTTFEPTVIAWGRDKPGMGDKELRAEATKLAQAFKRNGVRVSHVEIERAMRFWFKDRGLYEHLWPKEVESTR